MHHPVLLLGKGIFEGFLAQKWSASATWALKSFPEVNTLVEYQLDNVFTGL